MSDWIIATTFTLSVIGLKLLVVSSANNRAEWVAAGGTAILALAAIAALAVAVDSLGDARATRHGQLVTELTGRWDSPQMHESWIEFTLQGPAGLIRLYEKVYGGTPMYLDLQLVYKLQRWPDVIETIGVLHDEKVLSPEIIYKMWGPQINVAWEYWKDPVTRLRDLSGGPTSYRYFEALAGAMLKIAEAREAATAADAAATGSRSAAAEAAVRSGSK